MVRYVEEHLRSDTFDAALAAARVAVPARPAPSVQSSRWLSGALIALAAAAALVLALPGRTPPEGERDLAAPPPLTVSGPHTIRLGVGRSAVLALEHSARSLSMDDPTVAAIAPLGGADRVRITGDRPGRSLLHATLADNAELTWSIEVHADPTAPVVSDAAEVVALEEQPLVVQLGERVLVDLPWAVVSVDVGDPGLAGVLPMGPRQLAVDGLSAGTTDLLARSRSDELTLYVVTVRD